jgi:hypothetical protein
MQADSQDHVILASYNNSYCLLLDICLRSKVRSQQVLLLFESGAFLDAFVVSTSWIAKFKDVEAHDVHQTAPQLEYSQTAARNGLDVDFDAE